MNVTESLETGCASGALPTATGAEAEPLEAVPGPLAVLRFDNRSNLVIAESKPPFGNHGSLTLLLLLQVDM